MTIGAKFASAICGLLAMAVLMGGLAMYKLAALNYVTQTIITDPLPGMARIAFVASAGKEVRGNAWRHIASPDPQEKAEMDTAVGELNQSIEQAFQHYEKTITLDEDRALYETLKTDWRHYFGAIQSPLALSRAGKQAEAHARYIAEANPAFVALDRTADAMVAFNRVNGERLAGESQITYTRTWWTLALALAVCALVGSGLAFAIVASVNRKLRQAVAELSGGAYQVASAALQISAASQSLAQGASEQAASLEETSASSEEINAMAKRNSDSSQLAANLMTQSLGRFAQANRSLEEMVGAMKDINHQSDKVAKIIKVIDEIAFQTNILALNAAVEAARAGEAGMGFAVVAHEVRNLAQRSAQAARETATLIEETLAKSNDGMAKVDQVAAAVRAITADAEKTMTLVAEVNLGSQEQTRGIEQLASVVAQMDQVTQRTAANAEEGAATAQELTAQSETLKSLVSQLSAMVGAAETARSGER